MADPDWLKSMVFPGESGGDYGALYGFANKPGGAFAGVDLTKMTVNDVIKFTDPSGPYAQWVKDQLGYVATPTGGYQVVGSTLRDTVKGMGLTGNELYDQATQDAIGQHIYATQGAGAWEGWGKGGSGGGGPAVVASTKGGAPVNGLLGVPPEQDTSGLIGLLTGKQKPWAGKLNDIGAVLLALSGSPAAQPLMEQLNKRKDAKREDARLNQTAAWLASLGRDDLASAVMAGGLSGSDAAAIAMTPPDTPEAVNLQTFTGADGKVYSFNPATGETKPLTEAEMPEPGWVTMTPEEIATVPKLDPNKAYQRGPKGEIKEVGGGDVTVNTGAGETEFDKALGKADATAYDLITGEALTAATGLSTLSAMETAMADPNFYSGTMQGSVEAMQRAAVSLGIADPSSITSIESFGALAKNAALSAMGGTLGAGFSNADRDFVEKQVPALGNTPEGNREIIRIQKALLKRKQEMAALAAQYDEQQRAVGKRFDKAGFAKIAAEYAEANPLFGSGPADSAAGTVLQFDENGVLVQ